MPSNYYPSLLSHKGTLVRLTLEFRDSEALIIEPLHFGAGALILTRDGLALFGDPVSQSHEDMMLMDHVGLVVRHVDRNADALTSVATFVVYPNGHTFSGVVLEQAALKSLVALVWSTDLLRKVGSKELDDTFAFAKHWSEVPTIVGLPSRKKLDALIAELQGELLNEEFKKFSGCRRIEHTCPSMCQDQAKRLEREDGSHLL